MTSIGIGLRQNKIEFNRIKFNLHNYHFVVNLRIKESISAKWLHTLFFFLGLDYFAQGYSFLVALIFFSANFTV